MGVLIDSTFFIGAERRRLTPTQLVTEIINRWGDVEIGISVMTAGELLHGCWRADTPARRASRGEFVEAMLSAVPVVDITLPIMRVFAEVDASLRAVGHKLPTSDLLIACTALSRGDEIITGNVRHFRRIRGLKVREWTG